MRQKRIRNVEQKIERFSAPLVDVPRAFKGRWREAFRGRARGAGMPLMLEIGCGKGRFIKASALNDQGSLYIGFEGQRSVACRALQRAYADPGVGPRELNDAALAGVEEGGGSAARGLPDNLLLCAEYILEVGDYFAPGELNGIFLNFSDPWPKRRQQKRRLTSPDYLRGYRVALADGGFIRFKTDGADFFEYSRECMEAEQGFEITALTSDLRASEYAGCSEMTEYESRFVKLNRAIRYMEARKTSEIDVNIS